MSNTPPNELEKLLWAFHDDYGNSLSEWKNKDYDFAQTLSENEQLQIRPELIQALTAYVTRQRLDELKGLLAFRNDFGEGIPTNRGTIYSRETTVKNRIAQLQQELQNQLGEEA